MPKSGRQSIKAFLTDRADSIQPYGGIKYVSADRVEKKLEGCGLPPHEVELIMAYCVENRTAKDMITDQGWVSTSSVSYHARRVLKKLKGLGFKISD